MPMPAALSAGWQLFDRLTGKHCMHLMSPNAHVPRAVGWCDSSSNHRRLTFYKVTGIFYLLLHLPS